MVLRGCSVLHPVPRKHSGKPFEIRSSLYVLFKIPLRVTLLFSSCFASSWAEVLPVEGMLEATALQHARKVKEREGPEGKSTPILSEMIHITAWHPSAKATSVHYALRPETPHKLLLLLTSVWSTQRAMAGKDRQPVHDLFSPLFPLSLPVPYKPNTSLILMSLFFSLSLNTPLRQRRTKEETEESNITSWPLSAQHTSACLASDMAFPVLWRSSSPFDFSQMVLHSDRCLTFYLPLWHPSL